jgi:hypothetical protein
MKVTVVGHRTIQFKNDEELYCPSCGKHGTVWLDDWSDFYEGASHLCAECGVRFTMPSFDKNEGVWVERAALIRRALLVCKVLDEQTQRP